MPAIIRDSTPPPSVKSSMRPLGHQGQDPEIVKPVLRKNLIDDLAGFHGFITPGGKLSSQRLEDECSTALPSQCTTGSLESLPTTPAGFGTFLPPTSAGQVPSVPGQAWMPGENMTLPSLNAQDANAFSTFFGDDLDFLGMSSDFKRPVTECSEALSSFEFSGLDSATPPSTPRPDRTANQTCPLAPGGVPYPQLLTALSKNNLDLVLESLESDPESARSLFWDHNSEPPLCAAIRLGCKVDIVDLLIKFGADVKATNFAGDTPLGALVSSSCVHTAASSEEIEKVLLSSGAEPLENRATISQKDSDWDSNWNSFGLPPSLDSIYDIDRFFEIEPPPPPHAVM